MKSRDDMLKFGMLIKRAISSFREHCKDADDNDMAAYLSGYLSGYVNLNEFGKKAK